MTTENEEAPPSRVGASSWGGHDRSLQGKVAVVTGGSRGMGAAEAELLGARGCKIVIGDVLEAQGEEVAKCIEGRGSTAYFRHHDVTNQESWNALVAFTVETFGRIDVLVNNAGILRSGSILDEPLASFEETIRVNLVGTFLGMQSVGRSMQQSGSGSIINISSSAGLTAVADHASYGASKWGVRGLTKLAAIELGVYGIRVNSVHPGPIMTELLGYTAAQEAMIGAGLPIGRMGQVADVAEVVVFLASDRSSFMTGSELAVDGGQVVGAGRPRRSEG